MPPAASDSVDSDRSGPPIDVPDRTVPGSDSRQENGPTVEPIEEIDQYMLELLDRVNQRSNKSSAEERPEREESPTERTGRGTVEGSAPSPEIEPSKVPPSAPTVDREAAGASGPSPQQPQQPIPQRPVEPYRATPPPERACDLAAMRDLANESAEKAVAQFESRQLIRDACGKFIVVAMGVCSAVLLYLMSGANGWHARVSIGVALSVAVVWTGQAFILWIKGILRRRSSSRLASGATGDRESIRS